MTREPRFPEIRPRTRHLGRSIIHLAETESTMTQARRHAQAGAPEGLVVVATRQTAGAGRRGRSWVTVGASLHATILLRPDRPADGLRLLPLAAGAAFIRAVQKLLRLDLRLKWPNDVLHEDRKLAGILVETVFAGGPQPEFMLVGLGANGDAGPADFPPEFARGATSLSQASRRHVCLPALLKIFLEELEARYDRLRSDDPKPVWDEVRSLVETLGRDVRVETSNGSLRGTAVDLGPAGELLVRSGGRVHTILAGDCEELRPA